MLIKLAWKNIWRNKKRTIIVSVSIFFAVVLSSIMRSAQIGSFDYMIHSLAHLYLGYIQIQQPDFFEERSLDNSIKENPLQRQKIRNLKPVTGAAYRLETFGLLSRDSITQIARIIGVEPDREKEITALPNKITEGTYLSNSDDGVLIGDILAQKLRLALQDTVVLLSTGYHGLSAAALLRIKGILHFPIKKMNKTMLYMDIRQAQNIFSMPGRATSLVITLTKIDDLPTAVTKIRPLISENEKILDWEDLMPEIKQTISMKTGSNYIMIGILYMVIGFGIFGVIMMMTLEREKEYGILNSLGMSKIKMIKVSITENFFIVLLGVATGMLFSIPVVSYLAANPIPVTGELALSWEQLGIEPVFTFSNNPGIFIYQALIVFIIAGFCSFYPVLFFARLKIVEALKK